MRTAQTQKRQFNLSCIEKHRWHRDFLQTGQLTNDLRRLHRHGQDACAQRQGQDRAGREGERQGSRLPHLRRCDRVRRGLEEDLGGRPRIPLGQARRPELPGADLRLAGRDRRRGQLCPRLVPPHPRLSGSDGSAPPVGRGARTSVFIGPCHWDRGPAAFRFGSFADSRSASSSGVTSSTWLTPSALARLYKVTTVGLRRPRSRSLTYCWVTPDTSAKRS